MKKVAIYSTPTCTYCKMAKDFFMQNNVPYTDYNVAADMAKRQEMIERTGQMGVPVIDVDGQLVVGYDERTLRSLIFAANDNNPQPEMKVA